jgi:hypothetical protein
MERVLDREGAALRPSDILAVVNEVWESLVMFRLGNFWMITYWTEA